MTESSAIDARTCRVCGAPLRSDDRFCSSCGSVVPVVPASSDPSTLETREFRAPHPEETPASELPHEEVHTIPPAASSDSSETHTAWYPPESTVPPESGKRTLWIILGIVAFIVLVCCCLLPLALMTITSFDTALQDELRSVAITVLG